MQFYNTMSRKKETFTPVRKGLVGVYACGITAYALSHIGHARSAVAFDILVRLLRYKGYEVTFVRNFTDVDDKIIKRANDEGVSSTEIAETYIKAYHEDMDRLGVIRADIEPRATEHIQEMLNLTERRKGRPAGLRPLEKRQARRTLLGKPVGQGTPRLAHRVLGHEREIHPPAAGHPRRRA